MSTPSSRKNSGKRSDIASGSGKASPESSWEMQKDTQRHRLVREFLAGRKMHWLNGFVIFDEWRTDKADRDRGHRDDGGGATREDVQKSYIARLMTQVSNARTLLRETGTWTGEEDPVERKGDWWCLVQGFRKKFTTPVSDSINLC